MNKDFADDALRTLAKRRAPAWAQALLFALATAVFAVFAYHARYARLDEFAAFRLEELTRFTAGVFTALYAVTLLVQLRIGRKMPLGVAGAAERAGRCNPAGEDIAAGIM